VGNVRGQPMRHQRLEGARRQCRDTPVEASHHATPFQLGQVAVHGDRAHGEVRGQRGRGSITERPQQLGHLAPPRLGVAVLHGNRLTLMDSVPLPTRSRPWWKSANGCWWVTLSSIGSAPVSRSVTAVGQQFGPRWAPSTSSSLSSLMIDQSTVTSLPNTLYST